MMPLLETRELHQFLAVANAGSFSRAADLLRLSQPALSRAIAQLEERVGAQLFDRTTRKVSLTEAGQWLRPVVERTLAELNAGLAEFRQKVNGERGRLVIAALPSLAATLIPKAIAEFRRRWPEVEFRIIEALSDGVRQAVADHTADIGLAMRPESETTLQFNPIIEDTFGVVCRNDHPLASLGTISWEQLARYPFIAMAPGSSVRRTTDAAFFQLGDSPRAMIECTQIATVAGLVLERIGVSALPASTMPMIEQSKLMWLPLSGVNINRTLGSLVRREPSVLTARFATLLHGMA